MDTLLLFFTAYSVIGWISEVIYCRILDGHWTNRGFLHGPLCPIYGFGALLVVGLLQPFGSDVLVLFSMVVLVTSALEYLSSWLLEKAFHATWWDYSALPFNLHGRVCLRNSLMFGILGVIGVRVLHPALTFALSAISSPLRERAALALALYFAADLGLTLRSLVRFRLGLADLARLFARIRESMDFTEWFSEHDLRGSLARLRARAEADASGASSVLADLLEGAIRRSRGMRRLIHAFPGARGLQAGNPLRALSRLHQRARRGRTPNQQNPNQ